MQTFFRNLAAFCLLLLSTEAITAKDGGCKVQGSSCADLVYRGFTYPYPRPDSSYLYVNTGVYPYVTVTENLLGDSTLRLPDGSVMTARALLTTLGLEAMTSRKLTPVIGYGSNPAPTQLARKFSSVSASSDVVIPVMKGTLQNFDVVWTPVFVGYGSMPATITPSPGTDVEVWVTWLDKEAVQVVDRTEHSVHTQRPLYVLTTIEGAAFEFDGPDPASMEVYVSCFGPLTINGQIQSVSAISAKDRRFSGLNASAAMEAILPLLSWQGSVLDLIYDNVTSPEGRAKRSSALLPYGPFPDVPGTRGLEACKASRDGTEIPY